MPVSTANVLGPTVVVESVGPGATSVGGRWLCTWRIQNLSQEPLQLLAAGLPHSRFRSEEQALTPAPKLLPDESTRLALEVACHEPAATVVENAFLILRVLWGEQPWRILARLRVIFDQHGAPESSAEVITTQPVGFSASQVGERSRPE
jgi:hypothetical protein